MLDFLTEFLGVAFPWVILIIMLFGWGGLAVPIFPGNVVIWGAALTYGLVAGFETRGIWLFAFITLFMFIATAADNVFMGAKAKEAGASWRSIIIAFIAGAVTSFFLTPIAGLIVVPVTLYLTEYIRLKNTEEAMRITRGMILGCGWAFIVRFGLAGVQIGLYAYWAFGGG
ncbi:MAG: DUF456 domain-containing protein [Anaerolineales bacterium]|jgi:uncharacterized protein YqgC (DUF456 family)